MENIQSLWVKSPVGDLTLFAEDDAIIALSWGRGGDTTRSSSSPQLVKAAECLAHYFETGEDTFGILNLNPQGTAFQNRVWDQMRKISSGKTRSYGEVAATLKSGARAVGSACAANPIPILIPCHRILPATGKPGAYSGGDGAQTKVHLLRLEGALT